MHASLFRVALKALRLTSFEESSVVDGMSAGGALVGRFAVHLVNVDRMGVRALAGGLDANIATRCRTGCCPEHWFLFRLDGTEARKPLASRLKLGVANPRSKVERGASSVRTLTPLSVFR